VALGGGLEPYAYEEADAAPVATTLRVPAGAVAAEPVAGALVGDGTLPPAAGGGALAKEMIRVNHYGVDATAGAAQSRLGALGAEPAKKGLTVDPEGGTAGGGVRLAVGAEKPVPSVNSRQILNSLSMDGLPEFFCPLFTELNRGIFRQISTV
jgi:hypothetical protein